MRRRQGDRLQRPPRRAVATEGEPEHATGRAAPRAHVERIARDGDLLEHLWAVRRERRCVREIRRGERDRPQFRVGRAAMVEQEERREARDGGRHAVGAAGYFMPGRARAGERAHGSDVDAEFARRAAADEADRVRRAAREAHDRQIVRDERYGPVDADADAEDGRVLIGRAADDVQVGDGAAPFVARIVRRGERRVAVVEKGAGVVAPRRRARTVRPAHALRQIGSGLDVQHVQFGVRRSARDRIRDVPAVR